MKRKPMLCLLNVRHRWRDFSTEDGQRFSRCVRCGKDYGGTEGGGRGDWAAPIGY